MHNLHFRCIMANSVNLQFFGIICISFYNVFQKLQSPAPQAPVLAAEGGQKCLKLSKKDFFSKIKFLKKYDIKSCILCIPGVVGKKVHFAF